MVLAAVKGNGDNITYIPERYQNDREILLEFILAKGLDSIEYIQGIQTKVHPDIWIFLKGLSLDPKHDLGYHFGDRVSLSNSGEWKDEGSVLDPNEIRNLTRLMSDKGFVNAVLRCKDYTIFDVISDELRQEKDPEIASVISDFSEFDHESTVAFICNYLLVALTNDREIGARMYLYS